MSHRKIIVSAHNATLVHEDGSTLIDLFAANGTLLLGHGNPAVVQALVEQSQKVWITGRLDTDIRRRAIEMVEELIPKSHYIAGFYSTGMEAAEFALRASRVLSGRRDFIGFSGCMHGKSIATAFLSWGAPYGRELPGFVRLPFPIAERAAEVLEQVETVLARRETAAILLEVIQGSGGGAIADPGFCRSLTELCRTHQTLLMVDEILTGFYRSGPLFFHSRLPIEPDIILAGKCIGNGFPVSAVLMRRGLNIDSRMLPYSTYAENALASAAVVGTLSEMKRLPMEQLTRAVEERIQGHISRSAPESFATAIFGALCILDARESSLAQQIAERCYENGVFISQTGSILRLLPPVTIEPQALDQALDILDAAIHDSLAHRTSTSGSKP